ncbi:MAG: GNAT family N-acetyltransferase [Waterburya sp.]
MVEFVQINETDKVVQALEANLFSYFTNFGRTPLGEVYESSSLLYFSTGISSLFHNGVFRAQLQSEVERAIAQVIEYFAAKQVPFCWWTSNSTQPANLGKYLEAQGLQDIGNFPGMAIDLSNLGSRKCPQDLEIIRVEDQSSLESWLKIAMVGFDLPVGLVKDLLSLESSLGFQGDRYIRYLALWQKTPVAISALYLDAGVAGVYFVATLPEARGKGIGTQVTQTALEDAQRLGYRVATLQASAMGKNVYQRLGFQECCPIEIYLWQPPS